MVENSVMNYEKIEFESEGATLRGRLYRPAEATTDAPAIVMAHEPSTSATKAEASPPIYESDTLRASSSWATSAIDLAGSEIIVPPKLLPESAITFIEVTSFDELTVANNATGVLGIVRVFTLFTFVPLPELRTEL